MFKVGDKVNIRPGATSYIGRPLPSTVELGSVSRYEGHWNAGPPGDNNHFIIAESDMTLVPSDAETTTFKVGDRVRAVRAAKAPHTRDTLPQGYEAKVLAFLDATRTNEVPWIKLALPPGSDGPDMLYFEAPDFELVKTPESLRTDLEAAIAGACTLAEQVAQLTKERDVAYRAVDELHGHQWRANDLVGALETLLAAERGVSQAEHTLNTCKTTLQEAEEDYRKARASFDTNGGESK